MVNLESKKLGELLMLANAIVMVVLVNILSSNYFFRVDLTEEKRYSIKQPTKDVLEGLDDDVHIDVYLYGELNPAFERFRKSIQETLDEFRIYSNNKVHYTFIDPAAASSQQARTEFMSDLAARGIRPTNVIDTKNGERVEKIIFPGVIVSYGGMEKGVMLLKGNRAQSQEVEINQSIEGVEYELINAIHRLTSEERKRIGLVRGHQELEGLSIAEFNNELLDAYDVFQVNLEKSKVIEDYDLLIIAKPRTRYSSLEKYNLDQYIMKGGRVLFLLDRMEANMDSVTTQNYFAFPYELDLDDQLFKYGVRLNPDLVQDLTASLYPVVTGQSGGGKPKMELMDWPFFPLINRYADHPITRNIDAVITKFTSSLDTVKATGIRKTPLLFTSQYSRTLTAPVPVNVNELREKLDKNQFTKSYLPVGYLLEGNFSSLFKNRFVPEGADQNSFKGDGVDSKIIVIADGDLAANVVNPRTGQPQALGFDPFTNYTFANRDLLMNAVAFLVDDNGMISARNKEVKIRPLDKNKIKEERTKWQIINVALPVLVMLLYGIGRAYWRKRRFGRY
jgi:gliding-associated putative ABC transporter substrate-binding component GldG